jgi:hypothetical protein
MNREVHVRFCEGLGCNSLGLLTYVKLPQSANCSQLSRPLGFLVSGRSESAVRRHC